MFEVVAREIQLADVDVTHSQHERLAEEAHTYYSLVEGT
jgi:hypothetical protein